MHLEQLRNLGIATDHGIYRRNHSFTSDFSEKEIQKLRDNNFEVHILIDNIQEYYVNRNFNSPKRSKQNNCDTAKTYQTPSNFSLGSMGGYFTYAEFIQHIHNMHSKYPYLITQKAAIDTFQTHQNNPIYWLKISDNPNQNEAEPEVLYTALHHAREPASLSQLIFYMYYLLENYSTDDNIKALVDNTELYFIPMVNPDGYRYNESNNPNGGGMWRKNRRNIGNGEWGVDLNRNYGYKYGGQGSSNDPSEEIYRGTHAFSEPETQAVKWFVEQHDFKFALNYHTFGNLLLFPFGYKENALTPEHEYFSTYTNHLTHENNYINQTGAELYPGAGDSDDWMYADSSKSNTYAMTPEVGNDDDGFWPAATRIIPLCNENLFQNLTTARLAGNYATIVDKSSHALPTIGYIPFEIQRLGLTAGVFTVSLEKISNNISSVGSNRTINSITLLENKLDSIEYTLDPSIQPGETIQFLLSIDNGLYTLSDTIAKTYGGHTNLFSDNGNNFNNWRTTTSWNISTTEYYSPSSSITDSPLGNYSDNNTSEIVLDSVIDLSSAVTASINFWAKWNIETAYDYVQVLGSSDKVAWTPLCGNFTKPGTVDQDFLGQPIYDGHQNKWVYETINLEDFIGGNLYLKLQLVSDNFVNEDGFYFDDLQINIIPKTIPNNIFHRENNPKINLEINPNPSTYTTTIFYNLSQKINPARLIIYDITGKEITKITLNNQLSSITIDTYTLPVGTYFCYIESTFFKSNTEKLVVIR